MNTNARITDRTLWMLLVATCCGILACTTRSSDNTDTTDRHEADSNQDTSAKQPPDEHGVPVDSSHQRPTASLEQLSHTGYREPGMEILSGDNKPNGIDQRYRRGIPDNAPARIPRSLGGRALVLLDATPNGWLGLYEGPTGDINETAQYRAALFDDAGNNRWLVDLNQFFPGNDYLEVQDMRLDSNALYFNAACKTYADSAGGNCSWLFRVSPEAQRIDWRTPPRTSNNIFILHGPWIIAGYGFTNEPDSLYMIDKTTGKIVLERELDSAHKYLEVVGDVLHVLTYDSRYMFMLPSDI